MFFHLRRPQLTDGIIDLIPLNLYPPDEAMGFGDVYDFSITLHGKRREIGQISLRMGESPCLYYFGHIGYHIDPPWRGHHYAALACMLVRELFIRNGKQDIVITCDPDNIGSRKTCERVGAVLERTVQVPLSIRRRWEISETKCRYVWRLQDNEQSQ